MTQEYVQNAIEMDFVVTTCYHIPMHSNPYVNFVIAQYGWTIDISIEYDCGVCRTNYCRIHFFGRLFTPNNVFKKFEFFCDLCGIQFFFVKINK